MAAYIVWVHNNYYYWLEQTCRMVEPQILIFRGMKDALVLELERGGNRESVIKYNNIAPATMSKGARVGLS